ncbi:OFA family MFS transporter [Sporichthya brevicatena]|uniref:OFA family MFS transporter n=1 Tax=Sporichthya brevicatena TaxID=171442 RepID=A0ABN1HA07_9ACTN
MALGFLDRERTIAPPGWSRWLIPPAALSVHLAIGQAYAWSVFKKPLEATMLTDSDHPGTLSALPFQLGIVMLGVSAALFGTKVEARGPRWAMAVSSLCFCSGLAIASLAVVLDQYWLVVVGYGFVGGIGLGIGYISPVSTLIKWFPDRPGLATGCAIMGFGGGALFASPFSTELLKKFDALITPPAQGAAPLSEAVLDSAQDGIAKTFIVMAVFYAVFMTMSYTLVRVPAPGWHPGKEPPRQDRILQSKANVSAKNAIKTPQFWFLWVVLCFNVTAGIGILERAAPIFRDFFPDSGDGDAGALAAAAAGFVAILSLSNALGRILWSSTSDYLGRKNMYRMYLGVGALLYTYVLITTDANKPLFLIACIFILSFYGAGFATIPAYLKDLFGTYQVGAIHGRLLTAWSVAGVLGPFIINNIADERIADGKTGPDIYTPSFMIVIVLLVIAFICNEMIRPVDAKWHEPATADAAEPAPASDAEAVADIEDAEVVEATEKSGSAS